MVEYTELTPIRTLIIWMQRNNMNFSRIENHSA